jgi:hypothetical protein
MSVDAPDAGVREAVASGVEGEELRAAIRELGVAVQKYADAGYFGNLLNEQQVEIAQVEIAQMATALSGFYDVWRRTRASLPTSAEIERVVAPPSFRAGRSTAMPPEPLARRLKKRPFRSLVSLNEEVRRATETVTEALPIVRDQILYARHYERNCTRLYANELEQVDRLRDAEDMRLAFEQTLRAIQGDVDSLRAQAQSLTLYAQMRLTFQVQILTWLLLVITAAGVAAAFLHQ